MTLDKEDRRAKMDSGVLIFCKYRSAICFPGRLMVSKRSLTIRRGFQKKMAVKKKTAAKKPAAKKPAAKKPVAKKKPAAKKKK